MILEKVSEGKFRRYSAKQQGCSQQERLTYLWITPVPHINHSIPTCGPSWTLPTSLTRTPPASACLPKHPVSPLPTWVTAGIPYGISQVTLTPNQCWNAGLSRENSRPSLSCCSHGPRAPIYLYKMSHFYLLHRVPWRSLKALPSEKRQPSEWFRCIWHDLL